MGKYTKWILVAVAIYFVMKNDKAKEAIKSVFDGIGKPKTSEPKTNQTQQITE